MAKVHKDKGGIMRKKLMKPLKYLFLCLPVCLFLLLAISGRQSRAAERTYTLGYFYEDESSAATYKPIFNDLSDPFYKKNSIRIKPVYYTDVLKFESDIRNKKLDAFSSPYSDSVWKYINDKSYSPFATFGAFESDTVKYCIYVKKNSPYKEPGDLKGTKLGISTDAFSYFTLRKMVAAPPEDYFGSVTIFNDDISKIYAVAFGTMDAIHVSDRVLWQMKITDPGPAKLVRPISCVGDYYYPPLFRSNNSPDVVVNLLKQQFGYILSHPKEAMNDPEYADYKPVIQKYLPIIKKYKIRIISVTADDYKNVIEIFKTAKKSGWDKDYAQWKKFTKTKAE